MEGLDMLGADDIGAHEEAIGHRGGGGGRGGGGRGGGGRHHGGGHRHGGHRGMRPYPYPWYGGPWYGGPYYELDELDGLDILAVVDPDEEDIEAIAAAVAKRLKEGEKKGEKTAVGYAAPDKQIVVTPGAIKDEMEKVLREAETLDRDIAAYSSKDPAFASFKAGWVSFFDTLKKFYEENAEGVTGWLSRLWGSTGNQTVSYGNQINDWRAKFRQFSGAVVTEPAVTALVRREDPTKTNWVPYVVAAIVIVGLFAGGYALSKAGALAALVGRNKVKGAA